MFLPILNKSLAEKVKAIHIYANGYKLQERDQTVFNIDTDGGFLIFQSSAEQKRIGCSHSEIL
jgi:hypothetical protein